MTTTSPEHVYIETCAAFNRHSVLLRIDLMCQLYEKRSRPTESHHPVGQTTYNNDRIECKKKLTSDTDLNAGCFVLEDTIFGCRIGSNEMYLRARQD